MPKNARLNTSLLGDALIPVVDDIRRSVHGALGTRPWKVEIVRRSWSGGRRGVGHATETVLELDPVPMVEWPSDSDRLGAAGREPEGHIVITGVSLAYTMEELQPKIGQGDEVAYRLTNLHGQGGPAHYFVLASDPIPRRGDKPGDGTDWKILLNETSDMGPLDGVDA